jgi:hypothetical protein
MICAQDEIMMKGYENRTQAKRLQQTGMKAESNRASLQMDSFWTPF